MNRRNTTLTLFAVLLACSAGAQELDIIGWNLESDDNDPAEIAKQLEELPHYALYGLTEVRVENIERYRTAIDDAHPTPFDAIHTQSGGGDRMVIIFDTQRLELQGHAQELESWEGLRLNFTNTDGGLRFRSPFVATFRDRSTNREFLFMVNHLARGDSRARREQAKGLREWAKDQTLPVIAVGNYNFDFNFSEGENNGNTAFKWFMEDDAWRWVEPTEMIDTNWAEYAGRDKYPDTILDFIFLGGDAKDWTAESTILVRANDFPDNRDTSDHRPVNATITPALPSELQDAVTQMRADFEELQRIIDALKERLDTLEEHLPH